MVNKPEETRASVRNKLAERERALSFEVRALRAEVERMNNHRFIKLHDSLWKLGLFQLYRGLAFGLGSVLGASLLVSVLLFVLSSIDFIPVLGDWAQQIIDEMQR
ncbi:DUF5665 domain-containing protein [Aliiroseovarius sp. F47248L]|uniref:DUF5665 domain-containing protein n=1 Tax=Aliiroseovarius sp. F47248L TaxID=2926420 RepID=UPI001FF4AD10|nr:DUF5665 domain-containing protein [Aliiroseovarius sp. F47248L]MCK0139969.1 DUF5665 domain-containing protein [Aliiroseovarius sp. F47248L]